VFTLEKTSTGFKFNVVGMLIATMEAVTLFPKGAGNIINVGSVDTKTVFATSARYTGVASAVSSLTRSTSRELGLRGIQVNGINPGVAPADRHPTVSFVADTLPFLTKSMPPGAPSVCRMSRQLSLLTSEEGAWVTGALWLM
jgi:3-oxoacyl-[acyl-carrier protein] reductase